MDTQFRKGNNIIKNRLFLRSKTLKSIDFTGKTDIPLPTRACLAPDGKIPHIGGIHNAFTISLLHCLLSKHFDVFLCHLQ